MDKLLLFSRATALGLLTSFVFIYVIEAFGHVVYPLPKDLDSNILNDLDIIRKHVRTVPTQAMLFPLFSYVVGTFLGGYISNNISEKLATSVFVGSIILILNFLNLSLIPHPLWFQITSSIIPIPLALIGGYFSKIRYLKYVQYAN